MSGKLQGKHVLYILLGFFGVMVIVNGIFVYFALTSFSGLSVEDSYERGVNYNKVIASEENQKSRGWKEDLTFDAIGDFRGAVTLGLADKNGAKITGLHAVVTIRRPLGPVEEQTQQLVVSQGRLETEIKFASAGQWDLSFEITGGGFEQPYRLESRVWVK